MRLRGLIVHLFARVMCHRVCVSVCACSGSQVLNATVRTYLVDLCPGSLVLHAAVRTYLSPFCACDVPPRVCESACVCVCTGPLLCQSGASCGCADLFVTRLCVRFATKCVCVCVCLPGRLCVCVCVCACVCVCGRWPSALAAGCCTRLCGRICHLFVRTMCHHVFACVCVCACVCARVYVCVCVCECVCVCVCVCVLAFGPCFGSLVLHASGRTCL